MQSRRQNAMQGSLAHMELSLKLPPVLALKAEKYAQVATIVLKVLVSQFLVHLATTDRTQVVQSRRMTPMDAELVILVMTVLQED